MIAIHKAGIVITVEAWIKRNYPTSRLSPERYLALYGAELVRDGWTIREEER